MMPAETFTILPGVLPAAGTVMRFELYDNPGDALQQAVEEPGDWRPVEIRPLDHGRAGHPIVYAAIDAIALDPARAHHGTTARGDLWPDAESARASARARQAATAGPVTWTVVALWQVTR